MSNKNMSNENYLQDFDVITSSDNGEYSIIQRKADNQVYILFIGLDGLGHKHVFLKTFNEFVDEFEH